MQEVVLLRGFRYHFRCFPSRFSLSTLHTIFFLFISPCMLSKSVSSSLFSTSILLSERFRKGTKCCLFFFVKLSKKKKRSMYSLGPMDFHSMSMRGCDVVYLFFKKVYASLRDVCFPLLLLSFSRFSTLKGSVR